MDGRDVGLSVLGFTLRIVLRSITELRGVYGENRGDVLLSVTRNAEFTGKIGVTCYA